MNRRSRIDPERFTIRVSRTYSVSGATGQGSGPAAGFSSCGGDVDFQGQQGELEEPLIWEQDTLLEWYMLDDDMKFLANSTGALVLNSDITSCNTEFCTVRTVSGRMCSGERFASQPAFPSTCTGFLVGPRQVVTAAHCLEPQNPGDEILGTCAELAMVFRWRVSTAGAQPNPNLLREHVYNCENVLLSGTSQGQDWLVLELDREVTSSSVTPRGPLPLSRRATPSLVWVPQHPAGLATKMEVVGEVTTIPSGAGLLRGRIDSMAGSSGSPFVDAVTKEVVAVLTNHVSEVQQPPDDSCIIERECGDESECPLNAHHPGGPPGWYIPKGPRAFVGGSSLVRPAGVALTGDFDGDEIADIFWYAAGTPQDATWWGNADRTFSSVASAVNGTYTALVGDFDGDERDDIFWYAPGTVSDYIWWGNANRSFTSTSFTVNNTYEPFVGDFDGDQRSDVFWYRPGTDSDSTWWGNANRSFTSESTTVNGTFTPLLGDFDGDQRSDVFWYRPGTDSDSIWSGNANRTFSSTPTTVNGSFNPVTADFDGDSKDDVMWHAGSASTSLWWGTVVRSLFDSNGVTLPAASSQLGSGDFNGDGLSDALLGTSSQVSVAWGRTWIE